MSLLNVLSYPRSIIATILAIAHTVIMAFTILFLAAVVRVLPIINFFIIWVWSWPMVLISGARVEVRGKENAAGPKQGFLILFNHSSLMDIPVLYAYFPRPFRFGAKVELFRIPVFGAAMRLCGVLPIDRGDRAKVMKVYQEAVARIHNGEVFALAPEGTRQNNGEMLGKFKRGPFEFAIQAQMDIVPVVLAGAYAVLPKKAVLLNAGRWRRRVIMEILPRIPAQGLTLEDRDALVERTRVAMETKFTQLSREVAADA